MKSDQRDNSLKKSSLHSRLLNRYNSFPCATNAINYAFSQDDMAGASRHLKESHQHITHMASNKIKKGMSVFVYGFSNIIKDALVSARKKNIQFKVLTTECRPSNQGIELATQLAKHKIPIEFYPDSAARVAIKNADVCLMGCEAISSNGQVISAMGSEMIAELAKTFEVPTFICAHAWSFDPQSYFDFNHDNRAWSNMPKKVKVCNLGYEKVDAHLITAIISEIGTFRPDIFVDEVRHNYPLVFK